MTAGSPAASVNAVSAAGSVAAPIDTLITQGAALTEVAQALADDGASYAAVVDERGEYVGMITAHAVADILADEPGAQHTARDALRTVPAVGADETLDTALDRLDESLAPALAVVGPVGDRVVGWLTHENILQALRRPQ